MKKTFLAAVMAAVVAPLAAAAPQTPEPSPSASASNIPAFEVVSVRVNRSNSTDQIMRLMPGGRVVVTNSLLRPLIQTAYARLPQQLVGGPGWLDSTRFDIVAQATEDLPGSVPGGPPGLAQLMLQRLLAERFGLVGRTEARELPIYTLTLARDDGRLGPKLSPARVDCAPLMAAYGRVQRRFRRGQNAERPGDPGGVCQPAARLSRCS